MGVGLEGVWLGVPDLAVLSDGSNLMQRLTMIGRYSTVALAVPSDGSNLMQPRLRVEGYCHFSTRRPRNGLSCASSCVEFVPFYILTWTSKHSCSQFHFC